MGVREGTDAMQKTLGTLVLVAVAVAAVATLSACGGGSPKVALVAYSTPREAYAELIEPNPFTSGGAKWNIMAAYGAQLQQGKTEKEAQAYLADLFKHVPVQDKSAREALQTFIGGKGDVLLSYENEAIAAQQAGEAVDYVVPAETILIENPLAVTVDSSSSGQAQAFYDYLYTPEAQATFVSKGYRPVVDGVAGADKFPTPAKLFTIDDLGGWDTVNKDFFAPDGSVMATIEQGLGIGTQQ